MTQNNPQAPTESREQIWDHLLKAAQAGDTDAARLAQEANRIILTPTEQAELNKAAEAQKKEDQTKRLDYFAYGERWGQHLSARWCYDPYAGGYHQWDGRRWVNHPSTGYGQDRVWREVMHGESSRVARVLIQGQGRSQVLKGVESAIDRRLPRVVEGTLAVANGMVDLMTGALRGFDPTLDSHRALTGGAYQPQWTDSYCMNLLRLRFRPGGVVLLDDEGLQILTQYVGMAITGRAQRHMPILFLWGESGMGKGGALTLVDRTLGDRSIGTDMAALKGHSGDIDATQATILLHDILTVVISEPEAVTQSDFLARTGDNPISKRFPHGTLITGTPRCMYVVSAVDPPSMDLSSGFWRRTGVIKFPDHAVAAGADVIRHGYREDPTQEQMDALLTLAIRQAAAVYRVDYSPTKGNPQALEAFREAVDPLTAWLQELDADGTLEGRSIPSLCDEFVDAEGRKGLSHKAMRHALKGVKYAWTKGKWSGGGYALFAHRRRPENEVNDALPGWIALERARLEGKSRENLLFGGNFVVAPTR